MRFENVYIHYLFQEYVTRESSHNNLAPKGCFDYSLHDGWYMWVTPKPASTDLSDWTNIEKGSSIESWSSHVKYMFEITNFEGFKRFYCFFIAIGKNVGNKQIYATTQYSLTVIPWWSRHTFQDVLVIKRELSEKFAAKFGNFSPFGNFVLIWSTMGKKSAAHTDLQSIYCGWFSRYISHINTTRVVHITIQSHLKTRIIIFQCSFLHPSYKSYSLR